MYNITKSNNFNKIKFTNFIDFIYVYKGHRNTNTHTYFFYIHTYVHGTNVCTYVRIKKQQTYL